MKCHTIQYCHKGKPAKRSKVTDDYQIYMEQLRLKVTINNPNTICGWNPFTHIVY